MGMIDTVVQAACLSAFSNVLAQLISAYQTNTSYGNINFTTVLQFVTYSILNTPINCVWQDQLEAWFPSSTPAPTPIEKSTEKDTPPVQKTQGLDFKNTLIKFGLDQTIGAGFNIPLFIGIMGMLRGQNVDLITKIVKEEFVDIYISGAKLWPAVSLLCFTVIPPNRRVIAGSIAGVIWNIYLSLKAQ